MSGDASLPIDLNYVVAALSICGTLAVIGWKLGAIGVGILNRMGTLERKVEVLIEKIGNADERMNRVDSRIDRIETRVERLEQGDKP